MLTGERKEKSGDYNSSRCPELWLVSTSISDANSNGRIIIPTDNN